MSLDLPPIDPVMLVVILLLFAVLVLQIWVLSRGTARPDVATLRDELRDMKGELWQSTAEQVSDLRETLQRENREQRQELTSGLAGFRDRMDSVSATQRQDLARQLAESRDHTETRLKAIEDASLQQRRDLTTQLTTSREQAETLSERLTTQLDKRLKGVEEGVASQTEQHMQRFAEMRQTLDKQLERIRTDNAEKLETMRKTVDDKLTETLDKRLTQSFRQVSERLEKVHQGLGEMQTLASGVGDLKRVLSNVKLRGSLAETQLKLLLDQMLTPEQYYENVETKPGSRARVEFAIRLPGKDSSGEVLLPIDAKFPAEDMERLQAAHDAADAAGMEEASKQLERVILGEAKKIAEKYIHPPETTDFAILYLPTEALFAELLRRPGLMQRLQTDHRVLMTGPTTLGALLSSLQMGFRTLALEKRSGEIWKLLAEAQREFGKYAEVLSKVRRQVNTVSNSLDEIDRRHRVLDKTFEKVEANAPDGSDKTEPAALLKLVDGKSET
ncbi:MAG: DNA recombination protein RmuC [Alphaproteobacteria bacterium]